MYSDKALWVPLIYSNENSKPSYGGNHFIYPIAVFTPIACPVFGNVDSYGRLENIVRTPNVEAIEKYFNANIDDIIDNPSHFNIDGLNNSSLSGTFIHHDAFEWSKKNLFDDSGSNITNILDSDMKPEILNICGFNFVEKDYQKNRYNQLYTSERYPGVEWWSDGTWGNFGDDSVSVFNPVDFFKVLKQLTGIDPDPDTLGLLENTWSTLFHLRAQIAKVNKDCELYKSMKDLSTKLDLEELDVNFDLSAYDRQNLYGFCKNEGARWEAKDIVDKIYGHDLDLYAEDLANLIHLNIALYVNNRFWSPQVNGYQLGSLYQEKAMAQWIIDRADKELKAIQDEEEEFENGCGDETRL